MVACIGLLATICWSTRQARKGAAEPSDSGAEIRLVWVTTLIIVNRVYKRPMSYLVLARKWRPKAFAQVVGQQHVLRALINGLDQDRLHHAFLFSGTRGVGKTTLARIFAKSLNCEQGVSSTPCGECQSCIEVDSGRFVDLIEVDAASRTKVDDTRELLDNVQYAPSRGRYKVYLIDEVHMLSTSSFNALLKTLEEPPPHVKFLFATTDPQKLPVTILSRCLQFNLRRLDITQIKDHLAYILGEEDLTFDTDALVQIAHAADGSMRDALSLLDQAIAFGAGNVSNDVVFQMLGSISHDDVAELLTLLLERNAEGLLAKSAEFSALGRDFLVIFNALLNALQTIATLQAIPDMQLDETKAEQLKSLAMQFDSETVQLLYQITLHGKRDMAWASAPKSGFDMTLLRMLSFQPWLPLDEAESNSPKKPDILRQPAVSIPPEKHDVRQDPQQPDSKTNSPVSESIIAETVSQAEKTASFEPVKAEIPAAPSEESAVENILEPSTNQSTPKIATDNIEEADSTLVSVDLSPANWTQIISELKLSALTRQLAENTALLECRNNTLNLSLSADLAHLVTTKSKERLLEALQKKLSHDVDVIFTHSSNKESQGATVAVERAEQIALKQQQAIDSINNDPTIELIKSVFDARVIDNSIKPIE